MYRKEYADAIKKLEEQWAINQERHGKDVHDDSCNKFSSREVTSV